MHFGKSVSAIIVTLCFVELFFFLNTVDSFTFVGPLTVYHKSSAKEITLCLSFVSCDKNNH